MCTEQTLSARRNQAHPLHQATTCDCGRPRCTSVVTEYWHSMPNVFCLTWEMVLESTLMFYRVVVSGATTDDNTKKRVMAVKQMLRDASWYWFERWPETAFETLTFLRESWHFHAWRSLSLICHFCVRVENDPTMDLLDVLDKSYRLEILQRCYSQLGQ